MGQLALILTFLLVSIPKENEILVTEITENWDFINEQISK